MLLAFISNASFVSFRNFSLDAAGPYLQQFPRLLSRSVGPAHCGLCRTCKRCLQRLKLLHNPALLPVQHIFHMI